MKIDRPSPPASPPRAGVLHSPGTGPLGQAATGAGRVITVLVVDDSAYMRHIIANKVLDTPDIKVIDTASDGEEALAKVKSLRPDVVTLDVSMPTLDGLGALRQIMVEAPTRVIMLSGRTTEGAVATVEALRLGALDFVTKPGGSTLPNVTAVRDELLAKIRRLATLPVPRAIRAAQPEPAAPPPDMMQTPRLSYADKVLVIGASTGGPKALCELVPLLPTDLEAAVLIVQHMPPGFTKPLAQRLNTLSRLMVKEAQAGDPLRAGLVLLAPGDFHMTLGEDARIQLNQHGRIHGVRPAVDHTLVSVARRFGRRALAVILTGMGSDGCAGALAIKQAGGRVIVEDETTATIYGMPKAVVDAGAADRVLPLPRIAVEVAQWPRSLG